MFMVVFIGDVYGDAYRNGTADFSDPAHWWANMCNKNFSHKYTFLFLQATQLLSSEAQIRQKINNS